MKHVKTCKNSLKNQKICLKLKNTYYALRISQKRITNILISKSYHSQNKNLQFSEKNIKFDNYWIQGKKIQVLCMRLAFNYVSILPEITQLKGLLTIIIFVNKLIRILIFFLTVWTYILIKSYTLLIFTYIYISTSPRC